MQDAAQTRPGPASTLSEVDRRRTFAIISHPDAGKTTLTEKLLLFGGAIQLAGQVKARGERRRTRSDWMAIEQARGISVTSSVMTFERHGIVFNLLDTPGHADFSEDTYRTLSAVDAAVMVIDAARGIESQTRKLFEVCRLRDIPIVTFINKVDREGLDPLELLDEIASVLALDVTPGDLADRHGCRFPGMRRCPGQSPAAARKMGSIFGRTIQLEAVGDAASHAERRSRHRSTIDGRVGAGMQRAAKIRPAVLPRRAPVARLLRKRAAQFLRGGSCSTHSTRGRPAPLPRKAEQRTVDPAEKKVTGFIFKVQANMDPNHRDRIAFMRLCSGHFRRGMKLLNVREKRSMSSMRRSCSLPSSAKPPMKRTPATSSAFPTTARSRRRHLHGGRGAQVQGIPNFAPELLRRVAPRRRHEDQAAQSRLARSGRGRRGAGLLPSARIAADPGRGGRAAARRAAIAGCSRNMASSCATSRSPSSPSRWIETDNAGTLRRFVERHRGRVAKDRDEALVYLPESQWALEQTSKDWPELKFVAVRERG